MDNKYVDYGKEMWDKEYESGYGNQWPDSGMITVYHRYMKPHVATKKPKVLDFGCGIGQNLRFFDAMGFEVYGIDISEQAVERCVNLHKEWKDRIVCANVLSGKKIKELFDVKFDVIISCECLYYLNDSDIKNVLQQFSDCMTEEGRFYGTMHSWNSDSFKECRNCKQEDGLVLIPKIGRIDRTFAMNLIESEKHLEEKFDVFECEHIFKGSSNLTGTYMESFGYIGKRKE